MNLDKVFKIRYAFSREPFTGRFFCDNLKTRSPRNGEDMGENFQHFVIAAPQDEISRFMAGITFQINGFGYYLQQDAGIVPRFFTPDLEWIYCTKGESVIATEGQEYALKPGMLALLEPEKAYSARCTGKEPLHYYYIHFDLQPAYLKDAYIQRIFGDAAQRCIHADAIPNYSNAFASLLQDRVRGEMGMTALLYAQLITLSVQLMRIAWRTRCELEESTEPAVMDEDARMAAKAVKIMREERLWQIGEICKRLNVSSSYLYKLFMRAFHQSPSEFMMQERLRRARYLMTEKGYTVASAAEELGFSSASHLSRQCKQVYGLSPSQLGKANGGERESVE